jgi:hypothetical protein
MAIQVSYNINRSIREVTDDQNPRIYKREVKCFARKEWEDAEDMIWVGNRAYHVSCAPGQ